MGKIKSKAVRKAAKRMNKEGIKFSGDFNKNKKMLDGLGASKKVRNQLAGLLTKENRSQLIIL